MSQPSWKAVATAAVAGTALLSSGCALVALFFHAGPFMWSRTAGFAEAHDQVAHDVLDGPVSPAAFELAGREVDRALALSPYSNRARLRKAYIDVKRHGRLTPAGLTPFARSYDLLPYDHTVAPWRIRFALEHWEELTPELRTAVHTEALAFGRANSSDVDVRGILGKVRNPSGRLAASLWLRELRG